MKSDPHPRGGLHFENCQAGAFFQRRLARTLTQMDNMLFANMTLNLQRQHIDAHFRATETAWGRPLMKSLLTLGLMIEISVNDTTLGATIANPGMTEVELPAPLLAGDSVHGATQARAKRQAFLKPRHIEV